MSRSAMEAAARGDAEAVSAWLSSRDAAAALRARDEDGRTVLHVAAAAGHEAATRAALERCPALVDAADEGGWTPLHSAVSAGHAAVVQALLDAGADVAAKNETAATALHYAASKDRAELVPVLLAKGASISAVDRTGSNPLHRAASANAQAAAAALVEGSEGTPALRAALDREAAEEGLVPLVVALDVGAKDIACLYAKARGEVDPAVLEQCAAPLAARLAAAAKGLDVMEEG